jgi:serine/threonine-protein kinase
MDVIGRTFGNYRVVAKISEGGMGAVFIAEHVLIGRRVALKLLLKHFSTDGTATRRFLNEARAVNAIRHPHIVDITDVGTTPEGQHFLAMELLEGQTLADRLKEGPLLVKTAVGIAAQVAGALAAAHHKNIVHRDLKPGNIFLARHGDDAAFVKVLDFGIAKLAGQDMAASFQTKTGDVFGTPFYMSPEQCEGTASTRHGAARTCG